jgi:signal transduction histidine kinase
MLVDFRNYCRKLKCLEDIKQHLTTEEHHLPEPEGKIEETYQHIITSLYDDIKSQMSMMEKMHSEQVEYYTLWVHQIKTPISAMRLALQNGNPDAMNSSLFEQELFKIERYVEMALQYTKLKDLSSDLVIREYALEEIVHQSIKKYAPLFIYKKLSLNMEEFHAMITTDSKWLAFVLEQLLSNAIKYTDQGGITIEYKENALTITDTGIGIRKEDLKRIFEKGYTGYNGRIDKKASGIGLYLTKKVADTLAIKIEISSTVGEGTRVALLFQEEAANVFYSANVT